MSNKNLIRKRVNEQKIKIENYFLSCVGTEGLFGNVVGADIVPEAGVDVIAYSVLNLLTKETVAIE